jgi:hypothetical protein
MVESLTFLKEKKEKKANALDLPMAGKVYASTYGNHRR